MKGNTRVVEIPFDGQQHDSFNLVLSKGAKFLFYQLKGTVHRMFFQEFPEEKLCTRRFIVRDTFELITKDQIIAAGGEEKFIAEWVFSYFDRIGDQRHVFELVK